MKVLKILASVYFIFFCFTGCGVKPDAPTAPVTQPEKQVSTEKKFRVCADPVNPPYSTEKLDGFENKIAQLFADQLGEQIEYSWFPQRLGFIRKTLNAPLVDGDVYSKEFKCDVVMGVPAGYDMTLTTKPYYRSTYVLLIAKGRGFDDIKNPEQLAKLSSSRLDKLKIAMFDRGPGTSWLQKHALLTQGIPYQSMTGDSQTNIAMQLNQDFKNKKINMVILWGPMAAYIAAQNPKDHYTMLPMQSLPGLKFDFAMAMGVRKNDKTRQALLNKLIAKNAEQIQVIMRSYQIPLLPVAASNKH